jgi:hypothetical protein
MSYSVHVQDAELLNKMNYQINESAVNSVQDANQVAADITARTGIKVVARIDESTKIVAIKRLLVG